MGLGDTLQRRGDLHDRRVSVALCVATIGKALHRRREATAGVLVVVEPENHHGETPSRVVVPELDHVPGLGV